MTQGLIRYHESGNLHFVTFSCYERQPYLGTPESRDLFVKALEAMRVRYDFFLTGYVVMPEHVHLLVSEPKKALLSRALQALKLSVFREEFPTSVLAGTVLRLQRLYAEEDC